MTTIIYVFGTRDQKLGNTIYGYTGYTYATETVGTGTSKKPGTHTMTDQGYLKNEAIVKAKAKKVAPLFYINGYGADTPGDGKQVVIKSVLGALMSILDAKEFDTMNIRLELDSKYIIGWIEKLSTKGYEVKDSIVNANELKVLANVIARFYNDGGTITCSLIHDHTDNYGSIVCDTLVATALSNDIPNKPFSRTVITEVKEANLWKLPKLIPEIISGKRIYCRQDRLMNKSVYEMLTYDDDNFLGSNKACGYSIVKTPEPVQAIEDIKEIVHRHLKGVYKPYLIHLDTLGSSAYLRWLHLFSYDAIRVINARTYTAGLIGEDTPIFVEKQTNGIMPLVYESLDELYKQLHLTKDTSKYKLIEITDLFYSKDPKGANRILPDIDSKVNCINYQYQLGDKLIDIPISLGTDIADRNRLKRIEKDVVKVELILKEFPIRIQYTTRITLTDGTVAIWSSLNANNIFKKIVKKSRSKRFILK